MNNLPSFLKEVFRDLAKEKVTYCILKNYEELPEKVNRDIDIWVKKKDRGKFIHIILTISTHYGWELLAKSSSGLYKTGEYFFIRENKKLNICIIDILSLQRKGIDYLDELIIPEFITLHERGFYVPSPGIEAAALVFRGSMMGVIKKEQRLRIIECLKKDEKSFLKVLERPIGKKISETILNMIKDKKWHELESKVRSLSSTIFRRALQKRPFLILKEWLFYYYGRLTAHIWPPHGFLIVLMGPDGAGKTTVAKALLESEAIKSLFIRRAYFYRRFLIPWLKRIAYSIKRKGIVSLENSTSDSNFASEPLGFIKGITYLLYIGFEFFLGHYYVRRHKANCGILIFDRYFYDFMIFQNFKKCPKWIFFLIAKFIPKPDALIYLKNDPEVIFARKQQFSIEEIKNQSEICEEITRRIPNSFKIQTSSRIEEIIEKIQRIIINRMKERK